MSVQADFERQERRTAVRGSCIRHEEDVVRKMPDAVAEDEDMFNTLHVVTADLSDHKIGALHEVEFLTMPICGIP